MDTQLLRIAQRVARLGSFAAAARQLEVAPSSVSRSVALLEGQIGLRLFQRSTRMLRLTEEGRLFLDRTAPLLEAFDHAREEAAAITTLPKGLVRLSASVAFGHDCLMPLLPRLRKALPELRLEFHFSDDTVDLLDTGMDLAIRLAPAPTGDLISTRLMTTRYHVCAAPDYLNRHEPISSPPDLARHDCLLYALPGFDDIWRFRSPDGTEIEHPIAGALRISNALALRQAARLGCGPALLADWLVRGDIERGTLVDLFPGWQATATRFDTGAWLLYPSRRFLPRKTRAVIDFLKAECRR